MSDLLIEVRKEFSKVLLLKDIQQDQKDYQYARLMTRLEVEFKIPLMKDEKFEKKYRRNTDLPSNSGC
ncbi:hypothetical protein [Paenibacillus sp. PL91]|uniref:hypothetical protein n=1 Tax=Paenibacillus sp. PL91 TaxID=2729538 RepID=UPI00145C5DBB|nr:hypothetical protein [Paenibacillus sp. PL91]MBC9204784.1 hypothetical protein [Paenibacillus sp. PL91]